MIEDIVFATKPDGKVVMVGDWPERVDFSGEVLEQLAPFISVTDDVIEVSVYNGVGMYEITSRRTRFAYCEMPPTEVVTARLTSGFIGFDP